MKLDLKKIEDIYYILFLLDRDKSEIQELLEQGNVTKLNETTINTINKKIKYLNTLIKDIESQLPDNNKYY